MTEFVYPDAITPRLGSFDTVGNAMLTVVLGAVAVGVPALAPFASLVCMVLVVFKGLEIERDEIWFSTFTLLTGALALVPIDVRPTSVPGSPRGRRPASSASRPSSSTSSRKIRSAISSTSSR